MSANKPKTITVKDLKNLKNAEEAFAIKERIGAGTYGEVFTAMHKEKAKMVAIKAMNLQPDEVHEIVSEVNTLSQYSDHNNIARYFGCYIKRGPVAQIWIAMEYCAGGSIFDLIKHGGNNGKHYFKEEWIAYASREILEGLKYLHSMKVIHRDIKGQNILLTDKAEVKLVDFGVSAKLDKTVGKRCTFIGTPYWMAPEVIECEKDPSKSYTFECDIWSTGITAMEMAEGKPPLNDLHPMTALFKIPSNEPPKLKNPRDWSDKFKEFLKLCLKKNYKQRPSAENLLSYSRFVKAVNADRAQADLRQAIERVHRTKGHSRKLQRDMILRPDEGTSLEESDDEDNPETIKTIREQFRKMDNNPKQPFVPQPPQPQVVSSQVSHVAPPFHNRLNQSSAPQSQQQQAPRERGVDGGVDVNIRKMYENQNNKDRKSSVPFLNGNNPPLSTPPNSKEELSRKNSHEAGGNHGMNGHKPPFPLSASSENNRVQDLKSSHQQDVNKRSSRNFETSLSTDLDKTPTPASAVHANAPVRRHQNDPTPELPRKAHQPIQVTAKVDQNPPRKFSEQAQPRPLAKFEQPRKMSEHNPIARPSSAVKDLRQHPISRQNAPLARVTPAPISQTSVSIASNMSDRPLPAQPPKSSNPPMSSSSNNQSTPGGAAKFSHAIGQRQSISVMESSTESQNSKGIWNRSSRNVGGAEGPQNPSSAIGMPLKLENIEHSPGARRKSYAARSEELQPRIDNSGYAQLRLEGSVTESSSTDLDRERAHKPPSNVAPQHQNQPSFPYVDSDQDSTLSKPSTVKRANYSFEDSFTSCFNNSAYSNSEEERRKVMKSQNAEHSPNLSTSASNNSSVMNSGNSGHHRGQEVPVSRHNQVPNSGFGNTNDAGERDIPKHWQRGPPSSASVANSEYGSSAPVSTRQQMESSHQQHQIKSKGAVINPDYGTNINSNAVSNDQYGVSSKLGQDPAGFGRRVIDDVNNSIAVSNQAYDVNQLSASVDSDYESLVGPSRVVSKEPPQHIYTNQLDAVPEVEHQRRPNNQPNPERFDDSGVYAQFDADAAAYEVLYPPNAQHQPPQSETNNNNLKDPLPQPMPRNMSVSRERLAPSSSSEKSQEIHGAVSGRSSAANSSTNLHLSVGSESSVSLADDVTGGGASESSAVASRATEDEVSDDSDKEQADRFGTILVSSKPKPIQSEVSSRRIREASSGASSNKQMNRLSMGECSSSGSIKSTKSSNAAPLPNTSQQPTQPATNTTTTTTTNNSQGNEAVPRGHHKKSASRSKSQERPASQMSKKPAVVDLDNSARRPQQQQGATGGDERRQPHQDGSVANAVNLRKSKESKSGRSMEDISNKRASMVSVPSSQNMHADASRTPPDSKGPGVTSETPRSKISAADSKLKRQSTAENSPHNRSRKGSSSDHKAGHFNSFGFGVGGSGSPSSVNVPINISNNSGDSNPNASAASAINPEIRKFLKKFKSEVLCACLWGVNLLIGTTKGLYFMDRSGGCDVIRLVSDRKFTQMEIIPSLSLLVTISGKNNRLREYYLKVLHGKIVKQDQPSSGGKTSSHEECGDIGSKIEHCNSFKIVKYDAIRFLVVAYKTGIIVLAWAPKPCHKFMAVTEYKELKGEPLFVNVAIREAEAGGKFVLKVVYATNLGFHVVDDSGSQDIFMPTVYGSPDSTIRPHCIMTFPKSDEPAFLLCYNSEGAYVTDEGKFFRDAFLQWGEAPITSVAAVGSHHIMGWAPSAIEFRSLTTGQLDGVFMQRNTFKMRFLCECNDKVFFSSYSKSGVSQIYLLTLNHQSMIGSK
ncbi:TRAF2 and NCK-interacting protein kinase-like isoform X4 [Convolutriloba macropyga]|uniref:TRAF2 and NCK-interacting protein kinase-like isoform X4 n=1 Tax=Convolutriloba macropyga TaxID=536237 RepID=UPI003F51B4FA